MGYLLGLDIGSSSIKAALVDAATGECVASATSPSEELAISSPRPSWAEQDPEVWWQHVVLACEQLGDRMSSVVAVGIAYQMHGLVLVDADHNPLRPAIIWCDGRAVGIGARAFEELGQEMCLGRLLNSPGNFTASKLKWVQENEPDVFGRIHKAMLPGDYIAMKLTGEITTTKTGLSEAILWDFPAGAPAQFVADHYGFDMGLFPASHPSFDSYPTNSNLLGIPKGTPVCYRAGDQPNNAFSLNVLQPGEIAATAGTSGVIYGVGDQATFDPQSRVNTFVHVNSTRELLRYGTLLCINGTGSLYSWLRREYGLAYDEMNERAAKIKPGSDGLTVFPYGNGAERSLGNRDLGASFHGLQFNNHTQDHIFRAAQEGIVYSLNFGLEIMRNMQIPVKTVRAGFANLFLSPVFQEVFSNVTGTTVELYNTDGAIGAARGAGLGAGIYKTTDEAFANLKCMRKIEPNPALQDQYANLYQAWKTALEAKLQH